MYHTWGSIPTHSSHLKTDICISIVCLYFNLLITNEGNWTYIRQTSVYSSLRIRVRLLFSVNVPSAKNKKSRFFTFACLKIYGVEEVDITSKLSLLILRFLWVFEIWANFVKNCYFFNNRSINDQIWKFLTYIWLSLSTIHHILFLPIRFEFS